MPDRKFNPKAPRKAAVLFRNAQTEEDGVALFYDMTYEEVLEIPTDEYMEMAQNVLDFLYPSRIQNG